LERDALGIGVDAQLCEDEVYGTCVLWALAQAIVLEGGKWLRGRSLSEGWLAICENGLGWGL
jgi:hypothetical protein